MMDEKSGVQPVWRVSPVGGSARNYHCAAGEEREKEPAIFRPCCRPWSFWEIQKDLAGVDHGGTASRRRRRIQSASKSFFTRGIIRLALRCHWLSRSRRCRAVFRRSGEREGSNADNLCRRSPVSVTLGRSRCRTN